MSHDSPNNPAQPPDPALESLSTEALLQELKRRARALPPGTDLAAFITQGAQQLSHHFASDVVHDRAAARPEAAFPPSTMSRLPEDPAPSRPKNKKKNRSSRPG